MMGYSDPIGVKIATYSFTPGKDIKVIWGNDVMLKPQVIKKRLLLNKLFKGNDNVTDNDITQDFYKPYEEYEKEHKHASKFITDYAPKNEKKR